MPTRAAADTALLGRVGLVFGRLQAILAGPPVSSDGTIIATFVIDQSAILADAAALALAACNVTVVDPSAPADADYENLRVGDWQRYLDIAELRALESAFELVALTPLSISMPDYSRTRESIASLLAWLEAKRKAVMARWGYGVATLGSGVMASNVNYPACGGLGHGYGYGLGHGWSEF